jgi:hypothetical protein
MLHLKAEYAETTLCGKDKLITQWHYNTVSCEYIYSIMKMCELCKECVKIHTQNNICNYKMLLKKVKESQ